MRWMAILAGSVFLIAPCFAQDATGSSDSSTVARSPNSAAAPTSDDPAIQAQADLAARDAARAIAATQPSDLTNGEVQELRDKIAAQQQKIDDLTAQLNQLKSSQTAPGAAVTYNDAQVGMTLDQVRAIPEVTLKLEAEDTKTQIYLVTIGTVTEYKTEQQTQTLGTATFTNNVQVAVAQHPKETQKIEVSVATGEVTKVKAEKNKTTKLK
jgi:hypothetical protein